MQTFVTAREGTQYGGRLELSKLPSCDDRAQACQIVPSHFLCQCLLWDTSSLILVLLKLDLINSNIVLYLV